MCESATELVSTSDGCCSISNKLDDHCVGKHSLTIPLALGPRVVDLRLKGAARMLFPVSVTYHPVENSEEPLSVIWPVPVQKEGEKCPGRATNELWRARRPC